MALALVAALAAQLLVPALAPAIVFSPDVTWYTADPTLATYTLTTSTQMVGLAEIVNGTAVGAGGVPVPACDFSGKTIVLGADINFANTAAEQTKPIGGNGTGKAFNGTLDGNNRRVYGFNILTYGGAGVGLFGATGADSVIKNVRIDRASITLSQGTSSTTVMRKVGALVGDHRGSMANCSATADVSITMSSSVPLTLSRHSNITRVGGLAGSVDGDIDGCTFAGSINLSSPSNLPTDANRNQNRVITYVGGIVGYAGGDAPGTGVHGDISNCTNSGSISVATTGKDSVDRFGESLSPQSADIGGIVGRTIGNVRSCVNNSNIDVFNASGLGGIVGTVRTTITDDRTDADIDFDDGTSEDPLEIADCTNNGVIKGRHLVGGIVGYAGTYVAITRCANNLGADICVNRWNKPTCGGIAGETYGDITWCYNRGDVMSVNAEGEPSSGYYAAGIAGAVTRFASRGSGDFTSPQPEIYACYNVGKAIASGNARQGSLVGRNDGHVHDCVFLEGTVQGRSGASDEDLAVGNTSSMIGIVRNIKMLAEEPMKDGTATALLNVPAPAFGWVDYWLQAPAVNSGYPVAYQQMPALTTTPITGATVSRASNARYAASYDPAPRVTVTLGGATLKQDADFRVIGEAGARAVTASGATPYFATVIGMGRYSGTLANAVSYGIDPGEFSTCVVSAESKRFNWQAQTPDKVIVYDSAGGVVSPDDYTYKVYGFNTSTKKYEAGVPCVETRMNGYPIVATAKPGTNYVGSTTYYEDPNSASKNAFVIEWANIKRDCEIVGFNIGGTVYAYDKDLLGLKGPVSVPYTGSTIKPQVVGLTYLGRPLTESTNWDNGDYSYIYGHPDDVSPTLDSNTNVSTDEMQGCVTIRYRSGGNFTDWASAFFDIVPAEISSVTFSVDPVQDYTGLPITIPAPVFNGKTLVVGTDYTVTYANNTNPGVATYTVTGMGNFKGTSTGSFTIIGDSTTGITTRIAGANRLETAAAIAQKAYPTGANGIIIATAYNYPDALAASGLAGMLDYPILLADTAERGLGAATRAAIQALNPSEALIVGSSAAVSTNAENELNTLLAGKGSDSVQRIAGPDRQATADAIYAYGRARGTWATTAVVATGYNYPDALSISPYTAKASVPVFLVHPSNGLTASSKSELQSYSRVVIVGSSAVVPAAVETELKQHAAVTRLAGADRYATSLAIAEWAAQEGHLAYNGVAVATGKNFPDALAGGVLQGRRGAVLLLVDEMPAEKRVWEQAFTQRAGEVKAMSVLGSSSVVSEATVTSLERLLGWR
ncbi:MAG: cell wall-binding repeat-containing protein [Coriobacteriia bacterium]|nr:cell wall-binding repeat-containing protein [Coriobacteriia bacterium]